MNRMASYLTDLLKPEHVVVVVTSLVGAILGTRYYPGLPFWHRTANIISGFVSASLIGLAFQEVGWSMWLSSGMAYLGGHLGNWLMDGFIKAMRLFVADPLGFVARVITLIWQFKLPK